MPASLIALGVPASVLRPGLVRTPAGDVRCRAVLVATDPATASTLLPALGPVRMHALTTYGRSVDDWEHLTTVSVPAALPAAPPPQRALRKPEAVGDGIFVAGDHRASPSAQGALASGWRAAGVILRHLAG